MQEIGLQLGQSLLGVLQQTSDAQCRRFASLHLGCVLMLLTGCHGFSSGADGAAHTCLTTSPAALPIDAIPRATQQAAFTLAHDVLTSIGDGHHYAALMVAPATLLASQVCAPLHSSIRCAHPLCAYKLYYNAKDATHRIQAASNPTRAPGASLTNVRALVAVSLGQPRPSAPASPPGGTPWSLQDAAGCSTACAAAVSPHRARAHAASC